MKLDGQVGFLKLDLLHYNYESIAHFLSENKFNLYTTLEARQLVEADYQFQGVDLLTKPADEFLRRFFAEKGYQDGWLGMLLALLQGAKELVVYAKVWEIQGKKEPEKGLSGLLSDLAKQIKKKRREFFYWLLSVRIQREKNPLKKLLLNIKRRFTR